MKTIFAACFVAILLAQTEAQPVKNGYQNVNNHVIQKRHVQVVDGVEQNGEEQKAGDHVVQKREVQVAGSAKQDGDEQNIDDHIIQKRDVQQVEGRARQDSEVQEAHSRLGNYAIQGKGFQRVVASDEGGPIIQLHQDALTAGCRSGINCPKPVNEEGEE